MAVPVANSVQPGQNCYCRATMSEYCGEDAVAVQVSPEAKAKAKEFKDNGNRYLTMSKFSLAADQYTEAIVLDPTDPIFYANRAQAYIKMESYGAAILDANSAIT